MRYKVVTKTADFDKGGTDAGVYVKFTTPTVSTRWWNLENPDSDDMEQNDVDEYIFDVPADLGKPGRVSGVTVRLHAGGPRPEWTISYMKLFKSIKGKWVLIWNQEVATYDSFRTDRRPDEDSIIGAVHNGVASGDTAP